MPRARDPQNAAGRLATENWRKRAREAGKPETDAVDSALAAALAVFGHLARVHNRSVDGARFDGLIKMATNYLVANADTPMRHRWGAEPKHIDPEQARKAVLRRLYRDDFDALIELVNHDADVTTRSSVNNDERLVPPITP